MLQVCILFFLVASCAANFSEIWEGAGDEHVSFRKPKFFPSVGLVRFQNAICTSLEGSSGTCYTRRQCRDIGGIGSGSCANGIGTCCVVQVSCGATAVYNNTYFVNGGYPNPQPAMASCSLTIQKCDTGICQVRLDFLNFNLAQPDGNGNCVIDSFVVVGSASNVPIICGENTGEHIYANFNGDDDITLVFSTGAAATFGRSWNIKVTQLACDCPSLAPVGCLMYYTGLSGTVQSFNYGSPLSGALVMFNATTIRPGTRQLANNNYGVCVQMQPGYCSIQWSQGPDPTSFTLTGDTAAAMVINGLPSGPVNGINCITDFVVIPNPSAMGVPVNADRFCGNQFPTIISSSKPFVMTVVTDGDDLPDSANRGFSLNYQQLPCTAQSGMFLVP